MRPTPDGDLRRWAADTWRCLAAMTDPHTGLVADAVDADLTSPSHHTSVTNIGGLLWSAVAARDLGILAAEECRDLLARAIGTIAAMPHHDASGHYYNWYDRTSAQPLLERTATGREVRPLVSSVDTGWLATGLMIARAAEPAVADAATRVLEPMRWDMFVSDAVRPGGLVSAGFRDEAPDPGSPLQQGNHAGLGPEVWYLPGYDTIVSETRIASYLGIARGQVDPAQWFGPSRTFTTERLTSDRDDHVADCAARGVEPRLAPFPEISAVTRTHLGVTVVEGAVAYRGMHVVPGWGGSMFEELMPDLFVPEAAWGAGSWGRNHPLHVRAQIEHGLDEEGLGVWGFSPSSCPPDGYREYGVKALGMAATGYWSDGTVTPHAVFLALPYAADAAHECLRRLETDHGAYGVGGFHDAVDVRQGVRAERHLSLDQSMIMAAVANAVADDAVKGYLAPQVEERLRPLLGIEEFSCRPS